MPESLFLTIRGIQLHLLRQGQGPATLVMLHGLSSDVTFMQGEIDHLSQHFQVIAIDSRGHGLSGRPAHYTLDDHIQDVIAVINALGPKQVYLMGTSMGSYIAQGVAAYAPERVAKLVLIVPKASGKTSSTAQFLEKHREEVAHMSDTEKQAFVTARIFAPTTPKSVRQDMDALLQAQVAAGSAQTEAQKLAAQQALTGFDFRPVLSRITAPTLVISGLFDPLNPVEAGEEVARLIPGAQFKVLEHSGHVPALEQLEEMLSLIDAFLG